jgi:hypothetical protein
MPKLKTPEKLLIYNLEQFCPAPSYALILHDSRPLVRLHLVRICEGIVIIIFICIVSVFAVMAPIRQEIL